MSKKKPPKPSRPVPVSSEESEIPVLPKAPERLASPFKNALSGLKKQLDEQQKAAAPKKPTAPVEPQLSPKKLRAAAQFSEDDKTALGLAMQGVKRLDDSSRPARVSASGPRLQSRTPEAAQIRSSGEDSARARLDALVAEDVCFRIERDQGHVSAARVGLPPRVARDLARRTRADETLDLHGKTQRESQEAVVSFLKRVKRSGLDIVCIVHGKGNHSEGGLGVLQDAVIVTLTGPAAAHVRAFVTAPEALGGSGALLVEIAR